MNRSSLVRFCTVDLPGRNWQSKLLSGPILATVVVSALPGVGSAQPVVLEPRQPAAAEQTIDIGRWCANHRIGGSSGNPAEQARLKAAQADLAPGFDPGSRKDGAALVAAYQQELEQHRPDRALAATYLALLSTVPITLDVVERVNALLCVSSPPAFARWVAAEAEQQRRQMAR